MADLPDNLDDAVARVMAQRERLRQKARAAYSKMTEEEKEKERKWKRESKKRREDPNHRGPPVQLSQAEYDCLLEIAERHPHIRPFLNVRVAP